MITEELLFNALRARQPSKKLTQDLVDRTKALIDQTSIEHVNKILQLVEIGDSTGYLGVPDTKTPDDDKRPARITKSDIIRCAESIGVSAAALKAVIDVETNGGGFNDDGSVKILFERHIFYRRLTKRSIFTKRNAMMKSHPDICNTKMGGYNVRGQYSKLKIAITLNSDAAHEACSWGLGQVLGQNWEDLGYESVDAFVASNQESEAGQLDCMCRFIKHNGLVGFMKKLQWASFANAYNGSAYLVNKYDTKLATAYARAIKNGY